MGKIATSMAFEKLSGAVGDRVVARTKGGLATRGKPRYKYPKIPAVQEGNARLSAANAAWNAMSVPQAEAWNRYAEGLPLKTGFDGSRYATTGKNALVALTTKFLQANPGAAVPLVPPQGRYMGPNVTVSVSPSFHSGESPKPGDGEQSLASSALSPQPPLSQAKEGEPGLVFFASAPTPADTVVELLVQPLPTPKRSPTKFYKSAAFVAFPQGSLSHAIPVKAGWYACAYRFVEKATGRATLMMPLGKVEVPAP